ncbi:LrgB family protein [Rhodocista pekingensis]|uniref:LrgB family protein n=1 Tax=Rhodocista pekingensis TaxID=201185 RepID=A0ABW2KRL7_9PROT
MNGLADIWVYLKASPLLWLTATVLAYLVGVRLFEWAGRRPWMNPVALAVALLIAVLVTTGTDYQTYFDGAQFVHFLLGPATVALAVPLWQHRAEVRRSALPLAAALLAGSVTAVLSAELTARLLGATPQVASSIAPKSVTTPIAMGIAEKIGGLPSLTAALVICTGILGAVLGGSVLRLLRVRDPRAVGTAMGTAAHGIGTAAAFQAHPLAGTFAGIAMALNGLLTALLVPVLLSLFR